MRTCPHCGEEFAIPEVERGSAKVYCSTACKNRAKSKRQNARLRAYQEAECPGCGATFPKRNNRRYCSATCKDRARRVVRKCVVCRILFLGWADTDACSKQSCRTALAKERIRARFEKCENGHRHMGGKCPQCPSPPKGCLDCGTPTPRRKRCEECERRHASKMAMEREEGIYRLATFLLDGRPDWEAYSWREAIYAALFERDGGSNCALCGVEVDMALASGPKGDEWGPSIDHITPRSLGGSDDLGNLQLAHWRCNRAKGARLTTTPFERRAG